MKHEIFKLDVKSMGPELDAPTITSLKSQKGNYLLCGLLFSNPSLVKIPLSDKGECGAKGDFVEAEGLDVETQAGDGYLGVLNGLGCSTSGESVCTLLHRGFLPGVLAGLMSKDIRGKKGPELLKFLQDQEGNGGAIRHSVVHVEPSGDLRSRSFKEPGILWDVSHVGDFVFGLSTTGVWREPYLKPDKREFMRSDLLNNFSLHRDEDGYFWFLGDKGRLLRMGLTDNKAQLTLLKGPDKSGLFISSASMVDSWMYVTCAGSKSIMRVRRNPITKEDESQFVAEFLHPITAICVVDHPEVQKVFFALSTDQGAEIHSLPVIKPEDVEMKAAAPKTSLELKLADVKAVSSLTAFPQSTLVLMEPDEQAEQSEVANQVKEFNWGPKPVLWGAVGALGQAVEGTTPRIIRFSQF